MRILSREGSWCRAQAVRGSGQLDRSQPDSWRALPSVSSHHLVEIQLLDLLATGRGASSPPTSPPAESPQWPRGISVGWRRKPGQQPPMACAQLRPRRSKWPIICSATGRTALGKLVIRDGVWRGGVRRGGAGQGGSAENAEPHAISPAHIKGATMDRVIRIALDRVLPGPISLREDPRVDAAAPRTAVPS